MKIISDNIKFQQFKKSDVLTSDQLKTIAELIYDTDPYIYPALFNDLENAKCHLSALIQTDLDAMFCKNNFFIATIDDEIIGLILWYQSAMQWNLAHFISAGENCGAALSPHIKKVKAEYFDSYSTIPEDTISIINVCVQKQYRGLGVGQLLLKHFLESQKQHCEKFELVVLADNINAIKLYEQNGFEIVETINGFSIEKMDLPCYIMEKNK